MSRGRKRPGSGEIFVVFENGSREGFVELMERFLGHGNEALPIVVEPEPTIRRRRLLPDMADRSGYSAYLSVFAEGGPPAPDLAVAMFDGPKGAPGRGDARAAMASRGVDLWAGWSPMNDRDVGPNSVGYECNSIGSHHAVQLCDAMCDGLLALGATLSTGRWTAVMTETPDWLLIDGIAG